MTSDDQVLACHSLTRPICFLKLGIGRPRTGCRGALTDDSKPDIQAVVEQRTGLSDVDGRMPGDCCGCAKKRQRPVESKHLMLPL